MFFMHSFKIHSCFVVVKVLPVVCRILLNDKKPRPWNWTHVLEYSKNSHFFATNNFTFNFDFYRPLCFQVWIWRMEAAIEGSVVVGVSQLRRVGWIWRQDGRAATPMLYSAQSTPGKRSALRTSTQVTHPAWPASLARHSTGLRRQHLKSHDIQKCQFRPAAPWQSCFDCPKNVFVYIGLSSPAESSGGGQGGQVEGGRNRSLLPPSQPTVERYFKARIMRVVDRWREEEQPSEQSSRSIFLCYDKPLIVLRPLRTPQ